MFCSAFFTSFPDILSLFQALLLSLKRMSQFLIFFRGDPPPYSSPSLAGPIPKRFRRPCGLRTCIRRIMVDQSPISASGLTVAILAAYKTIFHLQRIWIVKGSAPIARFLAVVYVSNAPSTYIVGVVLEATAATTEVLKKRSRYLCSSWILVINGLTFPS